MREGIIEALAWALHKKLDPAMLRCLAVVSLVLFGGLVIFAVTQYQTSERRWGVKLVIGLACGAAVAGLGAACHWLLGVLYGVGYLLTWLVWLLTWRWRWWRRGLARGLTAGLVLGPWLWLGATEEEGLAHMAGAGQWLLAPNGLIWCWMLFGVAWLLVLVGGWGCWWWPHSVPPSAPEAGQIRLSGRQRRVVATWAVFVVLGLSWYVAGRVDLVDACAKGQHWRLGYVLVTRPGSQWYHGLYDPTLLHTAAESGQAKALRMLLAAGADVNATTVFDTPLHEAAQFGHAEALRVLLAAGADVNARDCYGWTPLDEADGKECVEVLRQAGGLSSEELDAMKPPPVNGPPKAPVPPDPGAGRGT